MRLTPCQADIAALLDQHGTLGFHELCRLVPLSKPTVWANLKGLKRLGLVCSVSVRTKSQRGRKVRKAWKLTGTGTQELRLREMANLIVSPEEKRVIGKDGKERTIETVKEVVGQGYLITRDRKFFKLLDNDERFERLSEKLAGRATRLWLNKAMATYPKKKIEEIRQYEKVLARLVELYGPMVRKVKDLGHKTRNTPLPFMQALRYLWMARLDKEIEQSWVKRILWVLDEYESMGALKPGNAAQAAELKGYLRNGAEIYDDFLGRLIPPKTVFLMPMYPLGSHARELALLERLRRMRISGNTPTNKASQVKPEESLPRHGWLTVKYKVGERVSTERFRQDLLD